MPQKRLAALLSWMLLACLAGPSFAEGRDVDSLRDRPGDYVLNRQAGLYARPSADSEIIRQLRPRTVVRVVEVTGQWYRVRSSKGNQDGWIRRSFADPFTGNGGEGGSAGGGGRLRFRVGTFRLTTPVVVHAEPSTSSKVLMTLREGTNVRVVDKEGVWYRIESESGNRPPGYIPTSSAERVDGDGGSRTRVAPPLRDDSEYRDDQPSRDR